MQLDSRDSIDFAGEPVATLFRKMLLPTMAGMVGMVILNFTDGAFIGHGAGSDALAAVNIAAPIFNLMAGLAIMFGIGCSVVASIHLSRGKIKVARINATQAMIGCLLLSFIMSGLILSDLPRTCQLFGSSPALVPLAGSYLRWIAISSPLIMSEIALGFIIRLDGSPRYVMACSVLSCALNIILDYVFIFPVGWGLEGAAIATSISFSLCGVAEWVYILFFAKTLRLYPLKLSLKSCWLTLRNLAYQVRMGFSVMLGEVAVSGAIIVGNYVFMHYLGESGVAAYSVICYCFPIIFMFANAIVQSAQPIVSFAHGAGSRTRLSESFRLIMRFSLLVGLLTAALFFLAAPYIPRLFLDVADSAYTICANGIPYFSLGIVFLVLNIVWIGYMQSVEQSARATVFTLLRGFLLVIPCFLFLPMALGTPGIWLAIPLAELSTFLFIFAGAKK